MLTSFVRRLEAFLFAHRGAVLSVFALLTAFMAWEGSQLRISAGFDKMLPSGHEYIKTFNAYRDQLQDANSIAVVVHPRHGDVWNAATLKTLLSAHEKEWESAHDPTDNSPGVRAASAQRRRVAGG